MVGDMKAEMLPEPERPAALNNTVNCWGGEKRSWRKTVMKKRVWARLHWLAVARSGLWVYTEVRYTLANIPSQMLNQVSKTMSIEMKIYLQ